MNVRRKGLGPMQYLHYIAGPLVGAVIGYFTNFLAVKMLFRPRQEVKVFGHTLPFTPGIIPKNKPRLAHAIGQAVANVLLTKEDFTGLITDSALEQASTALVTGSGLFSQGTLEDLAHRAGIEQVETERLEEFLTEKVWQSAQSMDLGDMVSRKAQEIVQSKPMLMLLPLDSILSAIKAKVNEYVSSEDCRTQIGNVLHEKVQEVLHAPTAQTLEQLGLTETAAESYLALILRRIVDANLEPLLARLDLAAMVEAKINDMDVAIFEDLIMSVMKNELNAIVNLGFFIGLIIGTVNIFI